MKDRDGCVLLSKCRCETDREGTDYTCVCVCERCSNDDGNFDWLMIEADKGYMD